jgi:hypothetical protein
MNLADLSRKYNSDKQQTEFDKVYDDLFPHLRKKVRRICEIGIYEGASLLMWRDYFPKAAVFGVDILPIKSKDRRIKTYTADQASREQLQKFIDDSGGDFDIIIEDGGHTMEQQQVSLGFLLPHVRRGGFYVIEDVQSSIAPPDGKWKNVFGIEDDYSNTTLTMIERFHRGQGIKSKYMTAREEAYCTGLIGHSKLCKTNRCMCWVIEKC